MARYGGRSGKKKVIAWRKVFGENKIVLHSFLFLYLPLRLLSFLLVFLVLVLVPVVVLLLFIIEEEKEKMKWRNIISKRNIIM